MRSPSITDIRIKYGKLSSVAVNTGMIVTLNKFGTFKLVLLSYQTTLGQIFLYFLTTKLTHIIQHFVMVKLDSGLIASKHVPLNFN